MWKRIPLVPNKKYVLSLCQDSNGRRFCAITEVGDAPVDLVRQTEEIPVSLLENRAWRDIMERFRLNDGTSFVFGPHGEWFTSAEVAAMDQGRLAGVPWITSNPPRLPAR